MAKRSSDSAKSENAQAERRSFAERSDEELTPLQKQYFEIKSQYKDCLLFFRLGDFYELFDEDAVTASRELNIMLTTRDRTKPLADQMPMCGVPYRTAGPYVSSLLQAGFKIAICEQLEDPATAKGLVKRGVVRVITPGMVTDDSLLDSSRPNYVCAIYMSPKGGGIAFCDITTGEFSAAQCNPPVREHLLNELSSFAPREVIMNTAAAKDRQLTDFLHMRLGCAMDMRDEYFGYDEAFARACEQFKPSDPERFAAGGGREEMCACGALLRYIDDTQKCDLSHINILMELTQDRYMELDWNVRRGLELTSSLRTGDKRGSLLWVLDHTKTAMGARTLRSWVELPLLAANDILHRLAAVRELTADNVLRGELRAAMESMGDMQRVVSRTVYQSANGRDLLGLAQSCENLPKIKELLSGCKSYMLSSLACLDTLTDIREDILKIICDEPPIATDEGKLIRKGYSAEVDRLRELSDNGVNMVHELEEREQQRTGIKRLKVGYNRVFGYYIDVPGSVPADQLPDDYVRKQTLANHERYFTVELKALEAELSAAQENDFRLEQQIFTELRARVAHAVGRIQQTASSISVLDALCSLAETAVRNNYVCPVVDDSDVIDIRGGRHPVVEQMQRDTRFVPNDTFLNRSTDRLAVITGPNMAGKSTYMRQTALIVLMAQMGSFVPAKSAHIGIVDRVFTRIGASDDLASGRSTFMVEMTEVADILKNATEDSLILLDEIGRGTSTYDGVAIARAVLEYCADTKRLGARTMLATHYHELGRLEGQLDGVKNYYITARKHDGKVIFLRQIVPGCADESYGIEVASLAGVPDSVVERARVCLGELDQGQPTAPAKAAPAAAEPQLTLGNAAEDEVLERIRALRLDSLSPIEAMNLLYEMQRKLEP